MITCRTIIDCLSLVLSKILLHYASNNDSETIVWWQNNMRRQSKIISLEWTVCLALDIALRTPQGPNTSLHYIPRDSVTFISEWSRSHGRSHGRQRFIQEERESPWAPSLTTEISPRNVEIPCCWKSADSEPLYWYLWTCLSSRVFHQIVACISRIALMVALLASLRNYDNDRKKRIRHSLLRAAFVVSRKKKNS